MGVSKNRETPQNGWFIWFRMEIPIKMDDWGYHHFRKHPYMRKVYVGKISSNLRKYNSSWNQDLDVFGKNHGIFGYGSCMAIFGVFQNDDYFASFCLLNMVNISTIHISVFQTLFVMCSFLLVSMLKPPTSHPPTQKKHRHDNYFWPFWIPLWKTLVKLWNMFIYSYKSYYLYLFVAICSQHKFTHFVLEIWRGIFLVHIKWSFRCH